MRYLRLLVLLLLFLLFRSRNGRTALHMAAENGLSGMVQLLLGDRTDGFCVPNCKAKVDIKDVHGLTARDIAARLSFQVGALVKSIRSFWLGSNSKSLTSCDCSRFVSSFCRKLTLSLLQQPTTVFGRTGTCRLWPLDSAVKR